MRRIRRKTSPFKLRIVDNSQVSVPKKISIFKSNVANGQVTNLWKTLFINNSTASFNFQEPVIIQALIGTKVTRTMVVTKGLNYQIENNQIVQVGNSQSIQEFSITNNTNDSIFVWVTSDRSVLSTHTIASNESLDFQYRPTIWIHATENLNEDVLVQNVNTELSLLGIKTSDISVEKTNNTYHFSLINIIFS